MLFANALIFLKQTIFILLNIKYYEFNDIKSNIKTKVNIRVNTFIFLIYIFFCTHICTRTSARAYTHTHTHAHTLTLYFFSHLIFYRKKLNLLKK